MVTMFEQSLILNDGISKKTGAIAASLTAQSLFVGVCILVPLLYHEVLPAMKPSIPLALPVFVKPPAPEMTTVAPSKPSRLVNPFLPPRQVPTSHPSADPVLLEQPIMVTGIYDPNAPVFPATILGPTAITLSKAPPPPSLAAKRAIPVEAAAPTAPVPITSELLAAKLIRKVMPVYPEPARRMRISGVVRLQGIIAKDGTIQNLQALSGHPLLIPSALEAVRQWVYRPTILTGQPVEVIAPIDVIFTLSN
jgi:protein TonB